MFNFTTLLHTHTFLFLHINQPTLRHPVQIDLFFFLWLEHVYGLYLLDGYPPVFLRQLVLVHDHRGALLAGIYYDLRHMHEAVRNQEQIDHSGLGIAQVNVDNIPLYLTRK